MLKLNKYIIYSLYNCTQISLYTIKGLLGDNDGGNVLVFPRYVGLVGFWVSTLIEIQEFHDALERVASFKISIFWVTPYRCV